MRLPWPKMSQNIAAIAFRAVGDENFVVRDFEPFRAVIVFGDGTAQKFIPLLRT